MEISKSLRAILLPLLAISLSACALLEPRDSGSQLTKIERWVNGQTGQQEEVLMLLDWFKVVGNMSPKQLRAAHRSAERNFSKDPTPVTRLQLAWLLAMKNTGFQDVSRAAKLLSIKRKAGGNDRQPDELDNLVYLVRYMVVAQKLQQDKHRQALDALDKEQQTSKQLAAKIKDLTHIEESMIQRKPLSETELK